MKKTLVAMSIVLFLSAGPADLLDAALARRVELSVQRSHTRAESGRVDGDAIVDVLIASEQTADTFRRHLYKILTLFRNA